MSTAWRHTMPTAKEEVEDLLKTLPHDATFEDIQYGIYVRQKIAQSLQAVEEGRVLSHKEVERRMARWLGE